MPKARAIARRRKSVRSIRRITHTMQMVATVKFQRALRRAAGVKNYALKLRELVGDLAGAAPAARHPLLGDVPAPQPRCALLVIAADRGLAGAYSGNVVRAALKFLEQRRREQRDVEAHAVGRKAVSYLRFKAVPLAGRHMLGEQPPFELAAQLADALMAGFSAGRYESVHVAYTDFQSASVQRAQVVQLLPLASPADVVRRLEEQVAEQEVPAAARGYTRPSAPPEEGPPLSMYDISPSPEQLLAELLPVAVRTLLFQCFLDAVTSENVARMVAMKSATTSADKMIKSLTMEYNRARQNQITTELAEIIGAASAMK